MNWIASILGSIFKSFLQWFSAESNIQKREEAESRERTNRAILESEYEKKQKEKSYQDKLDKKTKDLGDMTNAEILDEYNS
jgi:replication fork clamp-binding protein CrfC